MIRSSMIFLSLGIIMFSSWSIFVNPAYEKVYANDVYPGSIASKVLSSHTLFGQKDSISGKIKIISEEDGSVYIRLENFSQKKQIPACPNLRAFLSLDLDPKNKLDLGQIKATEGNINFEVPKDYDYKEYTHFLLWCETFSSDYAHGDIIEKENKGLFIK